MSGEYVCLNGDILPADQAMLSVFDGGLTHGAGLFETMRVRNGTVFRLAQHLERLTASAQALHIPLPPDTARWRTDIERLLRANEMREARMRLTVTPGPTQGGPAERDDDDDVFPGTVLITASPAASYPPELYARGMTVCVSSHRFARLDPIAGHKTVSYLPRLLALREAQQKHCGEALWFTTENLLAEGCVSNVFLVMNGVLRTPPLDTPVLPGITRGVVCELARAEQVTIEEGLLTIDDLLAAQEVFLTNALMGLMPVTRIERHAVGNEKPGALTRLLSERYRELVARETGGE